MSKPTKLGNKWRIRWIDGEGNRRSEVYLKHGAAVKALAQHQVEAERVKREGPTPRRDYTVDEVADKWVETRVPMKRSGATDLSLLKHHIRPYFGAMQLREITPVHIDAFKASRKHLTECSVNHSLVLLRALLGLAVDLGWLDKVPKVQKYRERLDEFEYLKTPDEVRRFLAAAHEERQAVYILYLTAVQTGMRCGELAGLRWDDVDFEKRIITVRRSYGGVTKGGAVRHVPILDTLIREFKMWKLESLPNPLGLVFPNERGKMLRRESRIFREVLARVIARAGLPKGYLSFHGLRHTYASHWVMNGGDIFRLQRILGHKSIAMTQRYSHLTPDVFAQDHGRFVGLTLGHASVATLAPPGNEERAGGLTPSVARSDGSPGRLAR